MDSTAYDDRAKNIISDIKEIIDVKGIDLDAAMTNAGLPDTNWNDIFSGKVLPTLSQFLALCEVSGIAFKLPSIETPDSPM